MNASAAESATDKTRQLIAVLQTADAPLYDKARACQQLGEFGTRDAVPALAALLGDEKLSAFARSGLEGIPDPGAAAALRSAAETLKGKLLVGVVISLGTLRDEKATALLTRLAEDPSSGASAEAMLALGRIANKEALKTLRQALTNGSDTVRANAAAGCLVAADTHLAQKRNSDAVEQYDVVRQANVPLTYRAAATRGAIVARKTKGTQLLVEQLRSNERIIRNAAVLSIRQIPSDALAKALNAELSRAPADLQVQIIDSLIYCHDSKSL
ncbi:MAG TPA: HEAT repeat domain-containing protein, partial [Burkholderiales bacterium]|nr:HEAT repeat domain-containing protein [Burkholderiales bacterium]